MYLWDIFNHNNFFFSLHFFQVSSSAQRHDIHHPPQLLLFSFCILYQSLMGSHTVVISQTELN